MLEGRHYNVALFVLFLFKHQEFKSMEIKFQNGNIYLKNNKSERDFRFGGNCKQGIRCEKITV